MLECIRISYSYPQPSQIKPYIPALMVPLDSVGAKAGKTGDVNTEQSCQNEISRPSLSLAQQPELLIKTRETSDWHFYFLSGIEIPARRLEYLSNILNCEEVVEEENIVD